MSIFDLRCALSGLSTTTTRSTSSVLLLEEIDGRWFPFTAPLSGTYNRAGALEGTTPALAPRIDDLFKTAVLTTESPQDLAFRRKPGQKGNLVEKYLSHAIHAPFSNFALKAHGHRVLPALYLDEAAAALVSAAKLEKRNPIEEAFFANRSDEQAKRVYVDWLVEQGRTALAAWYQQTRVIGDESFQLIAHWVFDKRGGFKPMQPSDAGQHSIDDQKAFAKEAWLSDEPAISRLVEKLQPAWVEEWKAAGVTATASTKETKSGRPYAASERYAVGDVVSHPTFGPGLVEELVPPNKLRARFGHELKTLVHRRA
jgi:hypothetical protein